MLLLHKILILCIRCNIISIMVIFTLNSMSHLALICNSKILSLNWTLTLITIAIIATIQSPIFRFLIVMYRHLLLPIIIPSIISNSSHSSSSTLLFILILVVNSSINNNNNNNNNNNHNINNHNNLGIRMIIAIK